MPDSRCKVDIVSERYDLDAMEYQYDTVDDRLLDRWLGENGRSRGYRTLGDWFNKRLLKVECERNGRDVIGFQIDKEYDVLTGDDELEKHELKDDLASDGISADNLLRDFVSWGTMRQHLTECLDGEKETTSAETDWESRSVAIATDRVVEKAEAALRALENKGELPGGSEANVSVQVNVSCPECPTRVPLEEAVDREFICREHLE